MRIVYIPVLMFVAFAARADVIFNFTLNTSDPSFSNAPPGPLSLGFQFADGSGTGDGNNSITLSNFNFGGGGPSGSPLMAGSATGDLSSSVTFTDATPTNLFLQGFTPGSSLSFSIDMTTNVDPGGIPDEFILSLLDSTLSPIPTTSSSPLFPLLVIDIDSANPSVQTFGVDGTQQPAAGGFVNFGAPAVTPAQPSSVPEPASILLGATVLVGLALYRRRRNA